MKKLLLLCLGIFFYTLANSQDVSTFNYQSVIRNGDGEIVPNQNINFRFYIRQDATDGVIVYSETQLVKSNSYGICNLKIGEGADASGSLSNISWGTNLYYLEIAIDINGLTSFTEIGTVKLVSVPYAMHAQSAENLNNDVLYFPDSDTLFVVKDHGGNIVFAVYPDGAVVYVNDITKGKIGGFAVTGRNPNKASEYDVLRVTPDSTRIYVEQQSKGKIGGFAVTGRNPSKQDEVRFLDLSPLNYFIGHESGQLTQSELPGDTGKYNIFIGYATGKANTKGMKNVLLGYSAGNANTTGSSNVFIGNEAGLKNTTGRTNVFIGEKAGTNNIDGMYNVFLGNESGWKNESGMFNVFLGNYSGYSNISGYGNTFIGENAGSQATDAFHNIFIGEAAGSEHKRGHDNVFLGQGAGMFTDTCYQNICIGTYAGVFNRMRDNIMIGHRSGNFNTEGIENIFLGNYSGYSNDTGRANIFIGADAGYNNKGDGNIFIGWYAGSQQNGSNKLIIENTYFDSTMALIYGEFDSDLIRINSRLGIGRTPNSFALEVEGDAYKTGDANWDVTSDRRIKTDIQDIENPYETLLKLRPIKFKFTNEWLLKHPNLENKYYYNFIAQEYQEVFPESVKGSGEFLEGDSEEILLINTQNAQIVTIKAVQNLINENIKLMSDVKKLKSDKENLEQRVRQLEEAFNKLLENKE